MTQINTDKVTVYGVEMVVPAVQSEKAVSYGVEIAIPAIQTGSIVLYAVEVLVPPVETEKIGLYAVETSNSTGDAQQPNNTLRPVYKSGSIPFIEFGSGTSLLSYLVFLDTQRNLYRLAQDGSTFSKTDIGTDPIASIQDNFNQVVIIPKSIDTAFFAEFCRVNMKNQLP